MAQHTPNQERSRKNPGSSSFNDAGQPSRAPGQDEQGQELVGNQRRQPHHVDPNSEEQGISNRPVKEEHAFPDAPRSDDDPRESVETPSKQQGGPRGRV